MEGGEIEGCETEAGQRELELKMDRQDDSFLTCLVVCVCGGKAYHRPVTRKGGEKYRL